jgi:glycosyltransferase involved in cell wall biosynthesis
MVEVNELSKNSRGGTELMLERLHSTLPADLLDKFQIIPSRVREIDPNRIPILWLHDLPNDPESQHLRDPDLRKRFKKIVAVSDWQMQMYNVILGLPYSESVTIKNGITPIEIGEKEFDGTVRIIYHTTPHRGLELLVPAFEELCNRHDNVHLDVFSSFSIYGWSQRDEPYRHLFDRCRNHPRINYHGAVSNEQIREELKKSHIFAYPSIWPETSCLAAIEALSAKNVVVCPNYAALPETTGNFANMYQWSEDPNEHVNRFFSVLDATVTELTENGPRSERLEIQKIWTDVSYNWEQQISVKWKLMLESLLEQA